MNKLLKIGIIGLRPYLLGGHDLDNPIRQSINRQIKEILIEQQKHNDVLLGLTGLNIGTEQDFAEICLELKIDYNVYLPYPSIDLRWKLLPEVQKKFLYLLGRALNVQILNKGIYSPQKMLMKDLTIIKDANYVIYLNNALKTKCSVLEELKKTNKPYTLINEKK